jgi:hypothetical protein
MFSSIRCDWKRSSFLLKAAETVNIGLAVTPFPQSCLNHPMIGVMRLFINILLFILGAVGSGICAFLLSAALADSGFLGSCFEGNCAYAALFMVLPVTWFVLFALYVMALLIWRRKPFRSGRL